eukprot:UN22927
MVTSIQMLNVPKDLRVFVSSSNGAVGRVVSSWDICLLGCQDCVPYTTLIAPQTFLSLSDSR